MASVKQRGESWRVVWRSGGREAPRWSATFPTEELAESARRLIEVRHHQVDTREVYAAVYGVRDDLKETPPTLAEWAGQWLAQQEAIGEVQPDTVTARRRILMRRVLPRLGALPLTAVTQQMVREWLAWVRVQPSRNGGALDADTVRKAHGVLHTMLGAAVPRWLPANPAARTPGQSRATGLPRPTLHEPVFLTPAEAELLLVACGPAIRDMVAVLLRTGLRLGELLVLRVEDAAVTGSGKLVRVRRALKNDGSIGPPKSRRSRRDVSISDEVAEVIARQIAGKHRSDLVFTAPRGGMWDRHNLRTQQWLPALGAAQRCAEHPPAPPPKPPRGPRRKWRPDEVSTCDCPTRLHRTLRIHDLRHGHASYCLKAGWSLFEVSRRLGHESIQTTADLYGHLLPDHPAAKLDAVERLLRSFEDEAA